MLRAEMATGYTITLSDTSSKKRVCVCVYERERYIEREMYRKKERVCEKLDEAFLFFSSHYAIPPITTVPCLVSPTNVPIQYILSIYIFPTRHMYSRGPIRLTSHTLFSRTY